MLHIRSPETSGGDRYVYHLDVEVISLLYAVTKLIKLYILNMYRFYLSIIPP